MRDITRLASTPEWKQFLRLGESLLNQPTKTQCELIRETLDHLLGAEARLWLARPYYPLPNEPDIETIPSDDMPAVVSAVMSKREAIAEINPGVEAPLSGEAQPFRIALPLITQDFLLGVLQVERPKNHPFRKEEINFLEGLVGHAALTMQINRQVAIKNWRSDQLALVREVTAQIANVLDLDKLCQRITNLIQETFGFYYVGILTLESANDCLHFRAESPVRPSAEIQRAITICLGEGIVGTAASNGQEILSKNVRADPLYRFIDQLPETKSELALPLKVENRILGVLDLQSDELNAFHEYDISVLRALADSIALAVQDARLYSDLERRAEQVSAVYEVTRAVTSILDLDRLLEEVVEVIRKRFGYPYVHIYSIHSGRMKAFFAAGSGERSQMLAQKAAEYDLDDEKGIIPWVARTGKSLLANDVSREPLYRSIDLQTAETKSELAVPLIYGGEVLAVLDIQSDYENAFAEHDLALFEALAGSIAIAIRNATLYRSETWRRQVADSFRDVAGLVSANTAVDELLSVILVELERNLPCDASAIWLVDEGAKDDHSSLKLAAARGVTPDQIAEALLESETAWNSTREALMHSQVTIRQPSDPYGPLGLALNLPVDYSSIGAPLRAGGEVLGLLTLAHATPNRYGSEAQAMTSTFASYAAVAIQNARLFYSATEQAFISTVLLEVAEASQSVTDIDELLQTMARLTPLLVGIRKCAFYLWDEWQQIYSLTAANGLSIDPDSSIIAEEGRPELAMLRSSLQPVIITDPRTTLGLADGFTPGSGTLVLLPLVARGQLLGAFLAAHEKSAAITSKAFNDQNIAILQGIAHQTAIALENIRLIEARQEEAYVTAVLLQAAQAVVSQNELEDILHTIVHLMDILVGLDTTAIYLWHKERGHFSLARASEAIQFDSWGPGRTFAPGEFPMLDAVFNNDQVMQCALNDPLISPDQWITLDCMEHSPENMQSPGGWLLGFPLSVKGEVYGVLVAQELDPRPNIHDRRLEIINGIAQQISLAVQNERLNEEMLGRQRLEQEIQVARQIQKTFLPDEIYQPHHWQIDARWQTARQVGGDFYDVFSVNKHLIGLVIADVADKGLAAALYMTVTRTLMRAVAQEIESPGQVLERVNNLLLVDSPNGLFVTAIYCLLDTRSGKLTYANAGHNRPILLRVDGKIEELPLGGMALGIQANNAIPNHIFTLKPGDSMLLFTDGVTESFSPDGEIFGDQRFAQMLQGLSPASSAGGLLEGIERELRNYRQGSPPTDDITMVAVHRLVRSDGKVV